MATDLDATDWKLLAAVQADARASYREIGRRTGLSTPTVAERLRRLEAAGVIRGYRARVDRAAAGEEIGAFLRLTAGEGEAHRVIDLCRALDAVIECHHVTGDDSFVVRVSVRRLAALEEVIARFRRIGEVRASVVLSSPVDGKPVAPPP